MDKLASFVTTATAEFRDVLTDTDLHRCLCRYLKRGLATGISQGELIDLLGVSSPSILEKAGYDSERQQYVMEMLATVTDLEIESTSI